MLPHINPTRQRGKRTGSLARASGWYMTFFAAGVIRFCDAPTTECQVSTIIHPVRGERFVPGMRRARSGPRSRRRCAVARKMCSDS